MAVSPDDRFAGLLNASAERGGWVPGDVFTADSDGEEEPVEPRRVRLPVLVAVAIATVGILVLAFFLFRPAPQHSPTGGDAGAGQPAATGNETQSSPDADGQGAGQSGVPAANGTGAGNGGATSATESGEVTVHVTGAVRAPSVVTLKAGDRVQDAVEAAGGMTEGADGEAVNLARILTDGEQIHIPKEGEEPADGTSEAGGGNSGGAGSSQAAGASDGTGVSDGTGQAGDAGTGTESSADTGGGGPGQAGKVDLNTADVTTLQTLPGVGPVTAEAIISHREQQPFASVEDLLLVKGIGPKTFESLKDLVTVG